MNEKTVSAEPGAAQAARENDHLRLGHQYRWNEERNLHSENVALLASAYGCCDDKLIAQCVLELHRKLGHLPIELERLRQHVHVRLYPILIGECNIAERELMGVK